MQTALSSAALPPAQRGLPRPRGRGAAPAMAQSAKAKAENVTGVVFNPMSEVV
jgi:hypothetical protein